MAKGDPICIYGHYDDEHLDWQECGVEGCLCGGYEEREPNA